MSVDEAVEVLRVLGRAHLDEYVDRDVERALSVLDGMHLYGAHIFKGGDEAWALRYLDHIDGPRWSVHGPVVMKRGGHQWKVFADWTVRDIDCFPTREAAEEECRKRNEGK